MLMKYKHCGARCQPRAARQLPRKERHWVHCRWGCWVGDGCVLVDDGLNGLNDWLMLVLLDDS